MNTSTAILIFGRTAADEARQKLSHSTNHRSGERLCEVLLQHTRRTAKATGYPVIWLSSEQQIGSNFGERLTHALDQVWAQGYQRVLLLGTDTPALSVGLLQHAARQLDAGHTVLGKAQDGGIYLLGVERHHYCPALLAALPWQQGTLFDTLCTHLQTQQPLLCTLPVLADVDNWTDIRRWIGQLYRSRLRLYLGQCLSLTRPIPVPELVPPTVMSKALLLPCNRPPPTLAAS